MPNTRTQFRKKPYSEYENTTDKKIEKVLKMLLDLEKKVDALSKK